MLRAIAGLSGLLIALSFTPALGQQPRRYQPATPTVSPYLNLTRSNVGGLPNYYSLVRPQLQQQAFNQQQLIVQAQQSAAVNRLRGELQQPLTPTGKASGFMTFSPTGAAYMRAAPYYPQATSVRRR